MSDIKLEFETALTNKLCLQSTDSISEEEILLKSFKQFDINNKETCNKEEFIQTIKKIGISGFNDNDLISLYEIYNEEKNSELNYIEFISSLYETFEPNESFNKNKNNSINNNNKIKENLILNENEIQGNISKKEYLSKSSIKEILEKIRNKLYPQGIKSLSIIIDSFRKFDQDNSQGIDYEEFKNASKNFNFDLNEKELKEAFVAFDRNNNGIIEYDEFIRTLRGEMNDFRKKIVFNAFKLIDINNNGAVNINEIKKKYNAKNHPDVKSGKKSEDEVLNDFLYNFDIAYHYLNGSEIDNFVIFDDFLEYYQNISMFIQNDNYFKLLVNSEWNVNNNSNNSNYIFIKDNNNNISFYNSGENSPNENNNNNIINNYNNINPSLNNQNNNFSFQMKTYNLNYLNNNERNFSNLNTNNNSLNILKKFRNIISSRGTRGIMSLRRSFMLSDDDNSNKIDFDVFIKYCFDYKIPLNEDEQISIFSQFDNNNEGQINYNEFLNILIGKMNTFRFQIVTQVFNILDINNNGYITINDMRNNYNVKNHPDVINGRRSAPEVEAEFLDNINYHFHLLRTSKLRNEQISFQEFAEYYDIISMSIHNDILFQNILINVWNLNNYNNKII